MSDSLLKVSNLSVDVEGKEILHDISLEVNKSEIKVAATIVRILFKRIISILLLIAENNSALFPIVTPSPEQAFAFLLIIDDLIPIYAPSSRIIG